LERSRGVQLCLRIRKKLFEIGEYDLKFCTHVCHSEWNEEYK
jgi:hypothetical protein